MAHALDTAVSPQLRSEIAACELNSAIAMDHKTRSWLASDKAILKSSNSRMPFKRIAQIPFHNDAREQIDKKRRVVLFPDNLEIGNVGYPDRIGDANGKFTI